MSTLCPHVVPLRRSPQTPWGKILWNFGLSSTSTPMQCRIFVR